MVEAMGWNQYGGWRIGVRSFDGKRYHYYAHLRKDRPYAEGLEPGQTVMAGDVIGYVGRTGYSATENTNNIDTSHLHYGLQLIFDESQKEGQTRFGSTSTTSATFEKSSERGGAGRRHQRVEPGAAASGRRFRKTGFPAPSPEEGSGGSRP